MTPRVPELSDGTVTLRAPRDSDIEGSYEQCQAPVTQARTSKPVPSTRADAETYVRHIIPGGWETEREWSFVVEAADDSGTPRFAGIVSLRNEGQGRAEIAYGSHPWARGRGVMEPALRLLLEWGFSHRDLRTVLWLARRGNWPSRRLAWRLGFTFAGTLPGWMEQRGELSDAWVGVLRRGEELAPPSPWLEASTVVGEAVVLRGLQERDLPRIVETLNDQETQRWHQRPREQAPHSLENQADFVLVRHEQAAAGAALHWAVADPITDAYLGQMSLFGVMHRRQASLSYWTHPDARGRGLTNEAARLVVRHCFVPWEDGGLGMRRLWADAELENLASRRVLESAGFVQTGIDRASEQRPDGTWADQARYDVLAADSLA
ncbi:MAG: GNAT family N-acetyltransferase [Marmoricola sp.]